METALYTPGGNYREKWTSGKNSCTVPCDRCLDDVVGEDRVRG